jgi:hypothetical protein
MCKVLNVLVIGIVMIIKYLTQLALCFLMTSTGYMFRLINKPSSDQIFIQPITY